MHTLKEPTDLTIGPPDDKDPIEDLFDAEKYAASEFERLHLARITDLLHTAFNEYCVCVSIECNRLGIRTPDDKDTLGDFLDNYGEATRKNMEARVS